MSALRQEIRFEPGYDNRSKPGGGQHGLQIRFLLHGDAGTVQFLLYTDWVPSHVESGAWGLTVNRRNDPAVVRCAHLYPMAADLGYHWRTRPNEYVSEMECDLLEGCASCFYDGSGLHAEPVMAALFTEGHEGVWRALEDYYSGLAGGGS